MSPRAFRSSRLTDWQHDKLYELKGQIVSAGIEALTGWRMPVFPKRRFQDGSADGRVRAQIFPSNSQAYRQEFLAMFS